jgi:hypothetical protein
MENSNPFRPGTQAHLFCEIAHVDYLTGFSDIVELPTLIAVGLQQEVGSNGGSWCRSDGVLGSKFNIHRRLAGGRIVSVQLVGFAKNNFTNKIDTAIIDAYKNANCRVLAIKGKTIEIDHKDGRKDDYSLHDNQTLDDFQPLHKSANVAKRRHCNVCKETRIRFDATRLGYSVPQYIGTTHYTGSCVGCYWYDMETFNRHVSEDYVKIR